MEVEEEESGREEKWKRIASDGRTFNFVDASCCRMQSASVVVFDGLGSRVHETGLSVSRGLLLPLLPLLPFTQRIVWSLGAESVSSVFLGFDEARVGRLPIRTQLSTNPLCIAAAAAADDDSFEVFFRT